MSHVSALTDIPIRDLDALRAAVALIPELEFISGRTRFNWYGRWVNDYHGSDAAYRALDPKTFGKCDHVIRLKDGGPHDYEIGVVADPNRPGHHLLVYDHFGSGQKLVRALGGQDLPQIKQAYAAAAIGRQAQAQRHRVIGQERLPDGTIAVRVAT